MRAPSLFFPMTPIEEWDSLALTLARGTDPDLFAYSIRYRYEGFVYEATVGEPRHRQAILEDRRGLLALLRRGDQLGRREDTGNVVLAIVRDDPLRIYEIGPGASPWPNPFLVASTEIEDVVGFSTADPSGQ